MTAKLHSYVRVRVMFFLTISFVRRAAVGVAIAGILAAAPVPSFAQDYGAVVAHNRTFHREINRIADNDDALPMLDRHWTLLAALWRNFGYGAQRFAGVANDHRHVIAAIAAHDQEAAASIMGAHAAKAKRELLARMPPAVKIVKGKRSA